MESRRPNILFVFTDQQANHAMGCDGRFPVSTPHMDRLAAGGVRFVSSYCASPVCGPSRASMVTGQPPHVHNLVFNGDRHTRFKEGTDRLPTVADGLREAGYEPYWIGKWHAQEFYPKTEGDVHGFHYLPVGDVPLMNLGVSVDAHATARAEQFLAQPPDKPWFLGVSWHNPHDICYHIMGRHEEELRPVTEAGPMPELPANFPISPDEPGFLRQCRQRETNYGIEPQFTREWTEEDWRRYRRAYARLTEAVDVQLGRLLDALERSGQAENTLVVFTSDHGESLGGHQLVVKLTPYEEAIGVPMLARLPGVTAPGGVCTGRVASGLDLLPTFLDLAGVPVPAYAPGESLLPQLKNPAAPGRDWAVVELDPDRERPGFTARVVVTPRWKYMAFSEGEPAEALYDLQNDPGEMRNVAADPANAEEMQRLRTILREWVLTTGDSFRAPLPVQS